MNHEINLTGYTATCGEPNNMLDLGTAGSYGLEKLHVTADTAWNGLTITATFTNSGSTTVAVSDGAVDVPPEATRMPTRDRVRYGQIAFKGADADGSIRLISTPIYYKVQASSATDGENTIAPTPDQYAQFVAEVSSEADRAEAAADRAESAGSTVTPEQIAEAVNSYLDENPVQPTAIDATLTQSGQAADAAVVGNRLSALSEEIAAIPSGKDGADGKSAYQYAVDGGYTGTETEFAEKMAQEKFANPNVLTFTGAVSATYDGSAAVSVEIPSGGGAEKKVRHIATVSVTAGTTSYSVTVDSNGDPLNMESVYILTNNFWGDNGSYVQVEINGRVLTRAYGTNGSPQALALEKMGELQKFTNIPKPSNVGISFGDYYNGKSAVTSVSFWSVRSNVDTTIEIYGVDA